MSSTSINKNIEPPVEIVHNQPDDIDSGEVFDVVQDLLDRAAAASSLLRHLNQQSREEALRRRPRKIMVEGLETMIGEEIGGSDDAYEVFKLLAQATEQSRLISCVYALFIDNANHLLGACCVAMGRIEDCPIDQRAIFRLALEHGATRIVVGNTHPSGAFTISDVTNALIEHMMKCGEIVGIELADFLVFSDVEYTSWHLQQESRKKSKKGKTLRIE